MEFNFSGSEYATSEPEAWQESLVPWNFRIFQKRLASEQYFPDSGSIRHKSIPPLPVDKQGEISVWDQLCGGSSKCSCNDFVQLLASDFLSPPSIAVLTLQTILTQPPMCRGVTRRAVKGL